MIYIDFGQRLKAARLKVKMTQLELSKRTGLSPQIISNIERGYTFMMSAERIEAIAEVLGVTAADLFDNNESSKEVYTRLRHYLPHELSLLLSEAKGLSSTDINKVIDYIQLIKLKYGQNK